MKNKNVPSISPIMRGPPFENLPHRLQKANAMLSPKSHQLRRNLKGVCILYKYNLKIIQIYNLTIIVWMWRFAQLSLKIWNLHNSWCKMVRKSWLVGISITKQKAEMKFPSESGGKTLHVHCGWHMRRSPCWENFSKTQNTKYIKPSRIRKLQKILNTKLLIWKLFKNKKIQNTKPCNVKQIGNICWKVPNTQLSGCCLSVACTIWGADLLFRPVGSALFPNPPLLPPASPLTHPRLKSLSARPSQ